MDDLGWSWNTSDPHINTDGRGASLRWIKRKGTRGAYLPSRQSRCSVLEFILTVLLLELTPGPNMAYLATLTLDRGHRAGLLATAGVAAGLSVHAIVAAFGLGVLVSQSPLIYDLLR